MRHLCALLLLTLLIGRVHAQVNTEKMRAFEVDGWATTLGGDLALRSGNSDLYELGLNGRSDARLGRHYAFLVGSLRYGKEAGNVFKNEAFTHLRYNYRLLNWLVAEGFGQIERDGFTLLQARLLGGVGVRFRHFHGDRFGLFQGTTLMVEYEDLDASEVGSHPATVQVWRWSNYVNVQVRLSEQTTFINTFYVQPQVDDFGDIRLLDEAALAIALTKHLTFSTNFRLRYDSRPPGDVESLDLSIRNGLAITF
jgi:hypothetical protein